MNDEQILSTGRSFPPLLELLSRSEGRVAFTQCVRALLAAPTPTVAADAVASAWKPIETAPKDREIWSFNGEQGRMVWSQGDEWALWVWCDELLSDADPSPAQPTHWMPLPSAPQGAAQ